MEVFPYANDLFWMMWPGIQRFSWNTFLQKTPISKVSPFWAKMSKTLQTFCGEEQGAEEMVPPTACCRSCWFEGVGYHQLRQKFCHWSMADCLAKRCPNKNPLRIAFRTSLLTALRSPSSWHQTHETSSKTNWILASTSCDFPPVSQVFSGYPRR